MSEREGLPRQIILISVFLCLGGCVAGPHSGSKPQSPPSSSYASTILVEFDWQASSQDNLGTGRTVTLTGREVSDPPGTAVTSCFGPDRYSKCYYVSRYTATTLDRPGTDYSGTAYITNAQPGLWQLMAAGSSSGGASAAGSCTVQLDSGTRVSVQITLGVSAACVVTPLS
jgi:hypothetical protein